MSRTANPNPPTPYFPQRTSTPAMRHVSPSPGTSVHFPRVLQKNSPEKRAGRRIKHLPPSLGGLKGKKQSVSSDSSGHMDEEMDKDVKMDESTESLSSIPERMSETSPSPSEIRSNQSDSTHSQNSSADSTSLNTPVGSDESFIISQYPSQTELYADPSNRTFTPISPEYIPKTHIIPPTPVQSLDVHTVAPPPSSSRSWVPQGLSKVAKAVLPSHFAVPWSNVTLGDKKKKANQVVVEIPVVWELGSKTADGKDAVFVPQARALPMPEGYLDGLDEEESKRKRREWAEGQHARLTELARLCSQWPQSGYHLGKWGPAGAKHCYEPQSYNNPGHVQIVMTRQAALESHLLSTSSLYIQSTRPASPIEPYPNHSRCSSSADSNSTSSIYTSPATSTSDLSVASEIRAAMTSPLLTQFASSAGASLVSLLLPMPTVPEYLKNTKSLNELNRLAREMMLSKADGEVEADHGADTLVDADGDVDKMEVDVEASAPPHMSSSVPSLPPPSINEESLSSKTTTRPARAQSCGSKRPLPPLVLPSGGEEEKRRKVDDEAMVVEDAVSTGVIQPIARSTTNTSTTTLTPSSSTQESTTSTAIVSEVFGHVVKTSTTHPIIISPFFPTDLLPILASHLIPPTTSASKPLLLKSDIDVPALLLSQGAGSIAPSPVSSFFGSSSSLNLPLQLTMSNPSSSSSPAGSNGNAGGGIYSLMGLMNAVDKGVKVISRPKLGNLLLSSCPGKRLRMGGPVKGRGPVCRDLKTDLSRIKAEGVGCLVCCLDDTELTLLGTPWETYRDVANDLGLDIIRLPMPDGFTPSSLSLFDSQVTLLASRYTLKGVNVLVHCRGGVGRAGVTACAWAIKMGFVQPHPSLVLAEESARQAYQQRIQPSPPASIPSAPTKTGSILPFFSNQKSSSTSTSTPSITTSTSSIPSSIITTPNGNNSKEMNGCLSHGVSMELEHQIVMSIVERVVAMIRSRRGLKAIESFEQVQFLAVYVGWLRAGEREREKSGKL